MNLNHYENATLCAHEIAALNTKYYTVPTPKPAYVVYEWSLTEIHSENISQISEDVKSTY